MSLLRTVSSLGRIKLTFVLGHRQLFSRSNGTTRKTVSKEEALEDVSERDNKVCLGTDTQHPWRTANVKSY